MAGERNTYYAQEIKDDYDIILAAYIPTDSSLENGSWDEAQREIRQKLEKELPERYTQKVDDKRVGIRVDVISIVRGSYLVNFGIACTAIATLPKLLEGLDIIVDAAHDLLHAFSTQARVVVLYVKNGGFQTWGRRLRKCWGKINWEVVVVWIFGIVVFVLVPLNTVLLFWIIHHLK